MYRRQGLKGLLEDICPGRVSQDIPLAPLTTFKIGGKADWFVRIEQETELERVLPLLTGREILWRILGQGSNLLISDRGVRGVVLHLTPIREPFKVENRKNNRVFLELGAGLPLAGLIRWGIKNGLRGLEFLAGIPGSLGGAWAMNAGSHGQEIKNLTEHLQVISPEGLIIKKRKKELRFGYRSLQLEPGEIILSGGLLLETGNPADVRREVRRLWAQKRAGQPLGLPSCGSVFRNPPGDFAGRLIEKAGLKGAQRGGAQISNRHANFIVNLGGARASDVLFLMNQIRLQVWKKFGVPLEPEVRLWGLRLKALNRDNERILPGHATA